MTDGLKYLLFAICVVNMATLVVLVLTRRQIHIARLHMEGTREAFHNLHTMHDAQYGSVNHWMIDANHTVHDLIGRTQQLEEAMEKLQVAIQRKAEADQQYHAQAFAPDPVEQLLKERQA